MASITEFLWKINIITNYKWKFFMYYFINLIKIVFISGSVMTRMNYIFQVKQKGQWTEWTQSRTYLEWKFQSSLLSNTGMRDMTQETYKNIEDCF